MTMATVGLRRSAWSSPAQISHWLFGTTTAPTLVRAAFVGLWAQMNYEQLTSLFRVEERSIAFVVASVANVADHRRRDRPPRRRLRQGRDRRDRRQLHSARSPSTSACSPTAASSSGSQFDRPLLRADEPLRAAARAVGARALGDQLQRPLLPRRSSRTRRGRASTRSACASRRRWCFLLMAFRARLARVRVLDRGRPRGEAHVRVRADVPALHLLVARRSRSACSRRGSSTADDARSSTTAREVVALLAFAATAYAGYVGRRDRRRPRAADAVQLGRHRRRRCAQHRAQLRAHPAVRDDRRRDRDARRVRRSCSSG